MIISLLILILAFSVSGFVPRSNRKIFAFCLLARTSISLINVALSGNFIGASVDANSFFVRSIFNIANISNLDWSLAFADGVSFFVNINTVLQFLNGEPSFLLAHMLSILISSLCMLLLVKTYYLFPQSTLSGGNTLLLLYSFTPSIILYRVLSFAKLAVFVLVVHDLCASSPCYKRIKLFFFFGLSLPCVGLRFIQ